MMFLRKLLQFAVLAVLMNSIMVTAQVLRPASFAILHPPSDSSRTSIPDAEYTVRRQVAEATMEFTAVDRFGRALETLSISDLQLFDREKQVTDFKSFSLIRRPAMHLAVLVDQSESIDRAARTIPSRVLEAMAPAFDSERDDALLIGFSGKSAILQETTSDFAAVQRALDTRGKPGLTSLFDTIIRTCEAKMTRFQPDDRRVLLLFSDGVDTLSIHNVADAIAAARRAGVAIYAVTEGYAPEGIENLKRLATATGGKSYVVHKERETRAMLTELNGLALDRYVVTFQPATDMTGFHAVRLSLPSRRDAQVRSAPGYYLNPGVD